MHLRTTLRFESRETLQALAVHDEPTQTRIFAMPERHRRHRHRLSPRVSYYIHFVLIGIVFNIHFSIILSYSLWRRFEGALASFGWR